MSAEDLRAKIREIPDFPKPGILFYDITTLLKDAAAYREAIDLMLAPYRESGVDLVVGMESRGFIFSGPIAYQLNAGLIPVRKLGKLPAETLSVEYALEYGSNTLEIHKDAIRPGPASPDRRRPAGHGRHGPRHDRAGRAAAGPDRRAGLPGGAAVPQGARPTCRLQDNERHPVLIRGWLRESYRLRGASRIPPMRPRRSGAVPVTTTFITRRERGPIVVQETADRALLRAFLETDRLYSAYALCDLDDREFLRTRWGVALAGGRPIAVVLQYAGYSPQPIFVMGENAGIEAILTSVIKPRTAYVAARDRSTSAAIGGGLPRRVRARRCSGCGSTPPISAPSPPTCERLLARGDRRAEPALPARLRRRGCLPAPSSTASTTASASAAGWFRRPARTSSVPAARLAVVGNVMTHTDFRGRGYATAVTGA